MHQTYRNLEIILIDDGSPDRCPQMCDEYAKVDARVKVIHQRNKGQSCARNRGLDIAAGVYITFLDSDDYWEKSLVEECLIATDKSKADMVLYLLDNIYKEGTKVQKIERVLKGYRKYS